MACKNVLQELKARNFIQQTTDPEFIEDLLAEHQITLYLGIDPTADSLHVGHLMGVMVLAHMQRFGHRPIAILGGGTALVGDPSGKTEMRKMLSRERIEENGKKIRNQLGKYLDFQNDGALLIDNHDWLGKLNYIDFLRDIGRHFSVNRMLTFETYKRRLESGLSFLEFNYQLLQAFDFYMLYKRYHCRLQVGGDDQWANILAGADLIRRKEGADVFGLTFPLITTATGAKMGKTEKGALWLDPQKTSPYDYYQYWVNVDDRDVVRFLYYFTFLPVEEIKSVETLSGADLNIAKTILAFEATRVTHGEKEANKALQAAVAAFGGRQIPAEILPASKIPRGKLSAAEKSIPGSEIAHSELQAGPLLIDILKSISLVNSKGEAKRLIQQGGVYLNEERITDIDFALSPENAVNGKIVIRLGKKRYYNLIVT